MLVQEGADPHIKNRIGQSPLQKCPSDLASVVRMFTQGHGLVMCMSCWCALNRVFCVETLTQQPYMYVYTKPVDMHVLRLRNVLLKMYA